MPLSNRKPQQKHPWRGDSLLPRPPPFHSPAPCSLGGNTVPSLQPTLQGTHLSRRHPHPGTGHSPTVAFRPTSLLRLAYALDLMGYGRTMWPVQNEAHTLSLKVVSITSTAQILYEAKKCKFLRIFFQNCSSLPVFCIHFPHFPSLVVLFSNLYCFFEFSPIFCIFFWNRGPKCTIFWGLPPGAALPPAGPHHQAVHQQRSVFCAAVDCCCSYDAGFVYPP